MSSKKSDGKKNIPWLVYNLPQDPHCIVITHIFKIDVIHLGGEGIMRHKKKGLFRLLSGDELFIDADDEE